MGALYSDNQPISDILKLKFTELKYWFDWHEIIQDQYDKAAE